MRKFFFLLMAMTTIVACQKDMNEVAGSVQNDESATENPYAISQEEAIANLEAFLGAFEAETRSTQRSIKSIETVEYSDIVNATRSSEEIDIDNLLYIVEFEDGQGSAVIGADRRVESVYAVLDESVLTVQDFENAANGVETDDISTYTAGLIAQSAANSVYSVIIPPEVDLTYDVYDYEAHTSVVTYITPMLNTKWGQGEPYNNNYGVYEDENGYPHRAPAGCGVIAAGQFITHLRPSTTITLNGHTHSYADMAQVTFTNNAINPILIQKIAQFIYDLSVEMDATYSYNGTNVSPNELKKIFRKAGLWSVSAIDIDKDKICEMLADSKPVTTYGYTSAGEGHAWIIDGRKLTQTNVIKVTYRDDVVISREYQYSYLTDYIHCNFGWDGNCDGYYGYTIFDTTYTHPNEPNFGDASEPQDYIFDTNIDIIKYNL